METHTKNEKPLIQVVVGPTAAGKTDYAIELAGSGGGAIVSADSRQVYTGMDIGTGKPMTGQEPHDILTPDVVEGVDHYLFNIAEPNDPIALAEWQRSAIQVIEELLGRGVAVVIAGGTMLYVDSIVRNFSLPAVEANSALRSELEARSEESLRAELANKDPAALEVIQPGQTRKMIRALEVIEATGRPFSEQRVAQPSPYEFEITGLFPGWEELERRITTRIGTMLEDGLLDETRALQEKYGAELPLLQTLNYKQAGLLLARELSEEAARSEMVRENLRYAKRQMKWWRNRYEPEEIRWISSGT